ncbi:urokinase-type plasminogen activator [Coregonus clupeaformis]|uniref:urokinase-type plasminogen activator n=1 Tax=Coregonus clupeaformis TaxID=59861 RepID=UPI001E1C2C21|nr:urokinase-type plasminogen activator [Coregonus clupeaformis]
MNLSLILSLVATVISSAETVSVGSWPSAKLFQAAEEVRKVRSSGECQVGDGGSYRGLEAVSDRGRRCLHWNRFERIGAHTLFLGLGTHNYCRNPDQSLRPWCRVRRGKKIVREFCDIPQCNPETGSPTGSPGSSSEPRAPRSPQMDTESTCGEKDVKRFKVVGGAVASVESQPWMAAIFHHDHFQCGGSLIAPCWVLTAAHCFPDGETTSTRSVSVYLGKSSINESNSIREQKFKVEQLILHQDYSNNAGNYNNDIALLKLRSKDGVCAVRSKSVRTVCLPPPLTMLPPGAICSIAGYGKTREGAWQYSQYLREAKVALMSQSVCKREEYYGNLITNNMFCAGSPDWKTDSCQGDSGGPLVCEVLGRVFVFGVVSWGDGCARKNKPGVYTRITNYNTWISQKTGLPAYTTGAMYPQK